MTIENETNEILDQGDVAEDFTPEVAEVIEEPKEELQEEIKEEVKEEPKPEKVKLTHEQRQAQISKQIAEKWEAKRALEAERQLIRQEREQLENLKKQHGIVEKVEGEKPNPNNYTEETAPQYIQDLARYEANLILKKEREEARIKSDEAENAKLQDDYNRKYVSKIEKDPTFKEKEINVARFIQLTNNRELYNLIMSDDDVVEVIDYLGGNLDHLERIAELTPMKIAKELGKITANIQVPKSRTVSLANAPINPVRQTGSNAVRNVEEMDHDSYSDYMNKKQYGF